MGISSLVPAGIVGFLNKVIVKFWMNFVNDGEVAFSVMPAMRYEDFWIISFLCIVIVVTAYVSNLRATIINMAVGFALNITCL